MASRMWPAMMLRAVMTLQSVDTLCNGSILRSQLAPKYGIMNRSVAGISPWKAIALRHSPNMALALDQFVAQLEDSGILTGDTLQDFLPPKGEPKDAEDLARELVRKKKLTKYQAEEVYRGKGKSLTLGNYVLLEKIGAGGMGQVFKARHRRMDRIVAVKLLHAAMTKDQDAIARFEREVKAAAKISHPNIVAAFDADQAGGVHFLVMELVEGSDLSAFVKKNGPLPVDKAVNYVLQAARGLEAAHAAGIVHRDIKPANLLLDRKGIVKILDMGLARLNGDGDAPTQAELTSAGAVMGTIDYMAPEQALNTRTADARADIYSLGCSLFYLLTGRATFSGDSLVAKLLAHREQPIPALREARPEVPESVAAVFSKMLAKKIEDRYQSMTEVITDLEHCGPAQEQSMSTQQSLGSATDAGLTNFLHDMSLAPKKPVHAANAPRPLLGKDRKKLLLVGGGIVAMLGVLISLAALVVVKLTTKDGTLIVTVNEPDAQVEVLDEEGKIEITRRGDKGPITISVEPGKHQLRVQKDGFVLVTNDFEIESGGKKTITAKLVPLKKQPAVVGARPAPPGGVKTPAVVGPRQPLAFETPGFAQWSKDVAALPAERQIQAVAKKLQELNPGFDGKETHKVENDVVTALQFLTDSVVDISPVRALIGLKALSCYAQESGKGKLADLSPLRGMPLTFLHCHNSQVSDLSPLQGIPLMNLNFSFTAVTDLAPLTDMPLTHLYFCSTQVSDLSPLKGMHIAVLECYDTPLSDLSPLKGMPLEHLSCGNTQVSDLTSLKGMSLRVLAIGSTPVSDLTPLKDLPLTFLFCDFKPFRDTELLHSMKTLETINHKPAAEFWKEVDAQQAAFDAWMKQVAGMPAEEQVKAVVKKLQELNQGFDGKVTPTIENGVVTALQFLTDNVSDISPVRVLLALKVLECGGSGSGKGKLADLSPLIGMQLTNLNFHFNQVSDLSPLRGMPLSMLACGDTKVSDLSPLKNMKLTVLYCYSTQVSDLSPLKDMKLTALYCDRTPISDLSPLKGMPLTQLICSLTLVSDLSTLKDMKLEGLACYGTPVSDFSPIKDMPLKTIVCDFKPERDTEILRSIKTLEHINDKPVAEFWKEVERKK